MQLWVFRASQIYTLRLDCRYDEINLNCGCPSDRVAGAGRFGASLMLHPELVAECCAAVQRAVRIPMTIKCRIGTIELSFDGQLPKSCSTSFFQTLE